MAEDKKDGAPAQQGPTERGAEPSNIIMQKITVGNFLLETINGVAVVIKNNEGKVIVGPFITTDPGLPTEIATEIETKYGQDVAHDLAMAFAKLSVSPFPAETNEAAAVLAKLLLENYYFITIGEQNPLIYRYDENAGIYRPDGRSFIEHKIESMFLDKKRVTTHLVNEVLGHIERATRKPADIFDNSIPDDDPIIVVSNGILHLNTRKLEPFSPNRYLLTKLPVKYDPNADCPRFKQFINEILDPDDVAGVQEELGAILRQKYLTKKFSIYVGETDTGKTTLISVITAFLGKENVSSLSLQDLASKDRFQLAVLRGKLANIRDDMPKDVIHSIGRIKELTGGFQVKVEEKFRDPYNLINKAYFIFTVNNLPPIDDAEADTAFFNRVVIRIFSRKYGGHDKPDRELVNKLTTPEELSGILNWALEGYDRLRANGWNFTHTESTEKIAEFYKRESDPVWAFVEDEVEEASEGVVVKEELYQRFRDYCIRMRIPLISKDAFYKTLPQKVTVTSGYRAVDASGHKKHVFIGIKLKTEATGSNGTLDGSEQAEQPEQGSNNFLSTGEPGADLSQHKGSVQNPAPPAPPAPNGQAPDTYRASESPDPAERQLGDSFMVKRITTDGREIRLYVYAKKPDLIFTSLEDALKFAAEGPEK